MSQFTRLLIACSRDEKGATIIEYALAVGSVALGCIIGMTAIGEGVGELFLRVAGAW